MASSDFDSPPPPGDGAFLTTRWSMVLGAREAVSRERSLEALCRQYWQPLFHYARRRGHTLHESQDLTQAFFERLLERDWLRSADREKGRFRTFLLTAMQRFLANEWDRARAQKRGGGAAGFVCLDALDGGKVADERAVSPEVIYDRRWALIVLETAMRRLREEHPAAEFDGLKATLTAERGAIDYEALAAALGMAPVSARSAVHRLRKRYREIIREEVADTVSDPREIEDELRALIAAMTVL